jgi:hypothetical protein
MVPLKFEAQLRVVSTDAHRQRQQQENTLQHKQDRSKQAKSRRLLYP